MNIGIGPLVQFRLTEYLSVLYSCPCFNSATVKCFLWLRSVRWLGFPR